MKIISALTVFFLMLAGCKPKSIQQKTIAENLADSISSHSDSSYTKPYFTPDFVTATYYVNSKDTSLSQVMKDSAGMIRQIIIARKNIRLFYGSYYKNGQSQASLPLDEFGQYHGTGTFYYEDGRIQSSGNYKHGLKTGPWKVFDMKGKITATDSYDDNGNLVPQKAP